MTTILEETDSSKTTPPTNPRERFLKFSDPFNPFRISNGDDPAAALVSDFLIANKYVNWSRAVSRALQAKNKIGFINWTIPKPRDVVETLFEAWEHCNDLVVSWLQNSVSPSVKSSSALVDDSRVFAKTSGSFYPTKQSSYIST